MKNEDIKIGDIVCWGVTKKSDWFSRLLAWYFVRFGQGGSSNKQSYSHSAIYAGYKYNKHWVFESTWPLSRLYYIPDSDLENYIITVFRLENFSGSEIDKIMEWGYINSGKLYDILEIITFGLINLKPWNTCSEFVKQAYLDCFDLLLGKPKEYLLSPNELVYQTKNIEKVCIIEP